MTDTHEPLDLEGRTHVAAGDGPNAPAATRDLQWYRSSGKLRELAWLSEGFAKSFAATAGGLLRADISARLAALSEMSRRQFNQAVEEPTCAFCLVSAAAEPNDNHAPAVAARMEFSPAIALAIVERLMGGPLDTACRPGRPLTGAERRVLAHLANIAAMSLSAARPGGSSGDLRADADGGGIVGEPDDRVVVATFELSLGGLVGTVRLCACGRLIGEGKAGTKKTRRVSTAPLKVAAAIEGLELDSAELADLDVGDILATDLPADGEIVIRIGGIPKYAGQLQVTNGRKVVTITRRLH